MKTKRKVQVFRGQGTLRKKWHQRRNDICLCQSAEEIEELRKKGLKPRKFKNCCGKNFKPKYERV